LGTSSMPAARSSRNIWKIDRGCDEEKRPQMRSGGV
jgi:hypothetical protein